VVKLVPSGGVAFANIFSASNLSTFYSFLRFTCFGHQYFVFSIASGAAVNRDTSSHPGTQQTTGLRRASFLICAKDFLVDISRYTPVS